MRPRAASVTVTGDDDGWSPVGGFRAELDTAHGMTRLVVSVPFARLPEVHAALLRSLKPPLGFLFRQFIDRHNPRPNGAPPVDRVALDVDTERLVAVLSDNAGVIYEDARAEVWVRGAMPSEQIVLDQDGVLYCYPDDPVFRDALEACGLPEDDDLETMLERDYVKHWYHPEHDAEEQALAESLRLVEV